MANALNPDTLKVALRSIDEFAARELPDSLLIELDERDEFPEEIVRRMSSGDELGIQLLFVPFEYGGMGGGAFDVYRICERMAAIDLGLATSELATFLGSDPIRVGGTEEEKSLYMGRIAKDGALFAYGATEPEAGSDLGALKTVAEPVSDNGSVTGYRISGAKQWISNGGVADLYTILAMTPGGPSWFVVEAGAEGFTHGHDEDKHGIRLSNTAALFLSNVYVGADRLIGGVEGQGLVQAQKVFGYTRLMVAAFGLGAGWSALDRAINAAAGRRPVVVLANLAGFDGSIVFCVISRYHGGAFVVFLSKLNPHIETVALEGAHASVIGGGPAAAVVFAREVEQAARHDPRITELDARIAASEGAARQALRSERNAAWDEVLAQKRGAFAERFDQIHSVERAVKVGSVSTIISPSTLRGFLIDAVERGIRRFEPVNPDSGVTNGRPGMAQQTRR